MKSVKLLLIAAVLMIGVNGFGQIMQPVKWKFSKKDLGNNEYELIFKATIDDHWHVYSQDIEMQPPATLFTFTKNDNVELIGKVKEKSKAIEMFDKNFGINVKYYEHEAVFVQKVKVKSKDPVTFEGYFEYMTCDDSQCMPPTEEEFTFKFNKPKK